jgi:hypothetical protein
MTVLQERFKQMIPVSEQSDFTLVLADSGKVIDEPFYLFMAYTGIQYCLHYAKNAEV